MIEVGQHDGDRELRTLVHWEPLRSGNPCEVGNLAKWESVRSGKSCEVGNPAVCRDQKPGVTWLLQRQRYRKRVPR